MIRNKQNSSEILEFCKRYSAKFDPIHTALAFKVTNETLSVLAVLFGVDIISAPHPEDRKRNIDSVRISLERKGGVEHLGAPEHRTELFYSGTYLVVLGDMLYCWDAERFDQSFEPMPLGMAAAMEKADRDAINAGDVVTMPWKGVVHHILNSPGGREVMVQLEDVGGSEYDLVRFKESEILSVSMGVLSANDQRIKDEDRMFDLLAENSATEPDAWTEDWAVQAFADASAWKEGMTVVVTDADSHQGWKGVVMERGCGRKVHQDLVPVWFDAHGMAVDFYPTQLSLLL